MKRISVDLEPGELQGRPVTNISRTDNPYGLYVWARDAEKAVLEARREAYARALEDLGAMPQTVRILLRRSSRWLEREVFE